MPRLSVTVLILFLAIGAMAQERRVTPVRPETNTVKLPEKGTDEKIIEQYLTGDTARARAQERKDSLRRIYPRYPRLTDMAIGINFIDPLLMAMGQDYAGLDVSATLNMWNRLQPTIEVGVGWAKSTPEDMNFTYRGKPSPYFKVGANYNFLFKSTPQYQALLGMRLGYSTFAYDITDVDYSNSYWQETARFDITGERSHALWGEVVAGLKVHIAGRVALGWSIRYHGLFDCRKTEHSRPWYIPGYGKRGTSLGFSLSAFYTLPLSRARWPQTP